MTLRHLEAPMPQSLGDGVGTYAGRNRGAGMIPAKAVRAVVGDAGSLAVYAEPLIHPVGLAYRAFLAPQQSATFGDGVFSPPT